MDRELAMVLALMAVAFAATQCILFYLISNVILKAFGLGLTPHLRDLIFSHQEEFPNNNITSVWQEIGCNSQYAENGENETIFPDVEEPSEEIDAKRQAFLERIEKLKKEVESIEIQDGVPLYEYDECEAYLPNVFGDDGEDFTGVEIISPEFEKEQEKRMVK